MGRFIYGRNGRLWLDDEEGIDSWRGYRWVVDLWVGPSIRIFSIHHTRVDGGIEGFTGKCQNQHVGLGLVPILTGVLVVLVLLGTFRHVGHHVDQCHRPLFLFSL